MVNDKNDKNDCINLANKLIIELQLDHKPIENLIQIDAEFLYSIIINLFQTDLLPKFKSLDFIDETEDFQFILQICSNIFDLDLKDINPAYLTRRRPECIKLLLNSLLLANYYIRKKGDEQSSELNSLLESLLNSNSNSISSLELDCTSLSDLESLSINDTNNLIILEKEAQKSVRKENERHLKNDLNPKKSIDKSPKIEKQKKELTNDELDTKLNELKDKKNLINKFTYMKQQNFALQISYKIMDVLKIQEKTKEIKSNLNKLKINEMPFSKPSKVRPIKSTKQRKLKINKQSSSKTKKLNLNSIMNQLTGLTDKQILELKNKDNHQKKLISKVRFNLVEVEKRLHDEMKFKLEKEIKLLELLERDLKVNLNLESKNNERKQLNKAKNDYYRERVMLKKDVDEYYRLNLSNYYHLENEQEKQLRELAKKNDKLFKEDLNELKKELEEYKFKMRFNQKLLVDNYDNLYASQSMLIKNELKKMNNKSTNDRTSLDLFDNKSINIQSINRHLDRNFKNKLLPKI